MQPAGWPGTEGGALISAPSCGVLPSVGWNDSFPVRPSSASVPVYLPPSPHSLPEMIAEGRGRPPLPCEPVEHGTRISGSPPCGKQTLCFRGLV